MQGSKGDAGFDLLKYLFANHNRFAKDITAVNNSMSDGLEFFFDWKVGVFWYYE